MAEVFEAITAARQPRSALNWLRNGAGASLLADVAAGRLAATHEALDAHPHRRAADYLRPHHHRLPARRAPACPGHLHHARPPCRPHRPRRQDARSSPRRPAAPLTGHRSPMGTPSRRRLVPLRRRTRPGTRSPDLTNASAAETRPAPLDMIGTLPVTSIQ